MSSVPVGTYVLRQVYEAADRVQDLHQSTELGQAQGELRAILLDLYSNGYKDGLHDARVRQATGP